MTNLRLFWSRVDRGECWEWRGDKDRNGYGRYGPLRASAHRISYELLVGPIPDGLTIDHLCRNRACVNPAHMEAVPGRVNTLRGKSFSAENARKTHCKNGHEYNEENTYWRKGRRGRDCRKCTCAAQHRYQARRAAA